MTSSSFVAGEKKAATATRRDLVFPGEEKVPKLAFCCEPETIQNTFDVNKTGLQRPRMPGILTQKLDFFWPALDSLRGMEIYLRRLFLESRGSFWEPPWTQSVSLHSKHHEFSFLFMGSPIHNVRILRIFDSSTVSVVDFRAYIYFLLHLV